jgi:hypothetical protein
MQVTASDDKIYLVIGGSEFHCYTVGVESSPDTN